MPRYASKNPHPIPDFHNIEEFDCPEYPLPDDIPRFRSDDPDAVAMVRELARHAEERRLQKSHRDG